MTDVSNQRVGFVGLGDQGGPMAVAIVEAGFLLHAWARRPQSYEALGGTAFERHGDLASLARAVDVLALCLRDDQDIRDLIEQHGLLDALQPGATVVNHGTGDPKENERIGAEFAARDVRYLDAPVSGGRPGAVARTLTTMVGGEQSAFDRCQPIFDSFSRKVAHMGPVGTGQLAKLLNNALTMTNLKNVADVFGLAHRLGIDLPQFQDLIAVSSGSSAILQAIGTQIDATAAAHLQSLMRKDIEHFAMRSATGGSTPPKFAPGDLAAPTPLLTSPTSLPSVRTPYDPFVAYGRSKTANILFAVAFDKRHRSRGVRAAAVHPGGVQTN